MLRRTIACYDGSHRHSCGVKLFRRFRGWLVRVTNVARTRVARWFRRVPLLRNRLAPRGRWISGTHREASGALNFAPFIAPERSYQLYFPSGYREVERLPLLVMLHGCKQDVQSFAAGTRINNLADQKRFLVLYPEQRRLANAFRCWNWFDPSSNQGKGEAAIVAGMVRTVIAKHNIDARRVYVAGISAGGALTNVLASFYAELFAAGAVHSGLMFQAASSASVALNVMRHGSDRDPLQVARSAFELSGANINATPIFVIQGDQDRTVDSLNAEQIVAQFSELHRLSAQAQQRSFDESHREKIVAPSADRYGYRQLDIGDSERPYLRQVSVQGLAHAWSGGNARYPYNDPRGPDANEMMWAFFALHSRSGSLHRETTAALLPRGSGKP